MIRIGTIALGLVLGLTLLAQAKDEALHAYLKGADVPLVGLMELHGDTTDEMMALLKASKDPKIPADIAGRRARLQALAGKNAQMVKLIDARQAPPTGKELKLSLTRAANRTDETLQEMQKALDRLEGMRSGKDPDGFTRQSARALTSLEAQRVEVEQAAELYKKLAVKALIK